MKKFESLLVFFGLLISSSCTNFLETEPEDFLSPDFFYSNEQQINTALVGIYNKMSDTRNGAPLYSSAYFTFMGTEGDDGLYRKGPERNLPGQFLYNPSTTYVANLWRALYEGINLANIMLERLDGADMDDAKREIVRGETLFLRAYYYFLLVSNYGNVPLVLHSTVTPDFNDVAQAAPTLVYERITQDMETAYGLVPTATEIGFGGRVNKSAVAGILARVYLYWAGEPIKDTSKYQNARDWAYAVISSGEHELNPSFEDVFRRLAADEYDIKESIWEVEFFGNRTGRPRQAGMLGNYIGIYTTSPELGTSNGNIWGSGRLYMLYAEGDSRRDRTLAPFIYAPSNSSTEVPVAETAIWTRYAGKYRRAEETFMPKSSGYTPINFPLLRYSDVLLMFAEAENEINGPTSDAVKYFNMVRRRAFGLPYGEADLLVPNPISDLPYEDKTDKVSFLLAIQDERSRELAFEALRKFDLVRWGIYISSMRALSDLYLTAKEPSAPSAQARNVAAALGMITDRHKLLPIPTREMNLNRELKQNPGW
ncbi:RagB/SusD family nutrient uptake outer membrane protein [Sphingobacterium hotanense]|uniref:RagB/SusD family nutrient uptake outer membrane protein n=1 Tax=Sphingobacterium hotanense TaxID=649196 RepID=UPI0021A786B3|nr:RagB/SusD family nutrient uptake outer membrane protein [Sphingobacterium hotanense]MCT1524503.1 RagB/SusD family nutrient uptake outer membrane protein [Sphingobacterium hotanense]